MLGQYAAVSSSSSDSRIFVYEVTGLHQNDQNHGQKAVIRSSDSQFIQVPASRMNETMQRITKMGGTIASIRPINVRGAVPAGDTENANSGEDLSKE